MPEKCHWCSNERPDLQEIEIHFKGKSNRAKVCNATCAQELGDFVKYADSHLKHYYLGFVLSIVIGSMLAIWRIKYDYGALGVFIIFSGSGLTLIRYPFVTPQTVALLGAKRAVSSGRIIGWLNIIIGVGFWFFLAVYLS